MYISVFDLRLHVQAERPEDLGYLDAFMDAFEATAPNEARRVVDVRVHRQTLPPASGPEVPVHRSKHPYWNIDSQLLSDCPRTVLWLSRGIAVTVEDQGSRVTIAVSPDLPPAFAGESIFHALRGICLALRPAGSLLHASAVVLDDRAIAFCGDSLSGKTTVMTQLVLRHGVRPLTNDRLLLTPGLPLRVHAWPSYASYCEGTLLAYKELASAAAYYESDVCPYRTRRWTGPLSWTFDKERKRTYPLAWLSQAAGCKFVRQSHLAALVFLRVSPKVTKFRPTRIPLHDRALAGGLLAKVVFADQDPSFMPWHGLPMPSPDPAFALIDEVARSGVALYELEVPVADLGSVFGFVAGVLNDSQ